MVELTKQPFGTHDGREISLYRFRNSGGGEITITDFGGRIVNILVPDRDGKTEDIALGFDSLAGYVEKNPYFGALVGRYANRIADGRFSIGGVVYHLAKNDPPNTLHGGFRGFDSVPWNATSVQTGDGPQLRLEHTSPDGDQGFPGTLDVVATYSFSEANELRIHFEAKTTKQTVLNLTNHSYFDLSGQGKGNILDHVVEIFADRFTPVNEHLIPTGELKSVQGTPFDFRSPHRIGDRIDDKNEQLKLCWGYDHNYVLSEKPRPLTLAARAVHPETGRVLEVSSTQPGVQFYSGNHLKGNVHGKGGNTYPFRTGFCLETQHFPDSPNQPNFPSTLLAPGEVYESTTVFKFSVSR